MRRRKFRLARTALLALLAIPMLIAVGANRDDVVQAQRLETVVVSIFSNGIERQVRTAQTTVGEALKEAGVRLGPLDKVTPATDERPYDGMKIAVVRIYEAVETINEPIAFSTVRTFTKSLRPGEVKVANSGAKGEKQVRYLVRYENGDAVKRTKIGGQVVRKPVNKVVSIGARGYFASRSGGFLTRRVVRMVATAYDPGPRSCGRGATGRTACGMRAGYGVVAVDPRVIRLGTKLYIEGYGLAVAGDTGSAIKGNKIDLGFNSYREAMRFGRRVVTVHVLQE